MNSPGYYENEFPYDLEIESAIKNIKESGAKKVCIQFPDGLKTHSQYIYDRIINEFEGIELYLYLGSCFGACDIPPIKEQDFDLLIQWGHSRYIV